MVRRFLSALFVCAAIPGCALAAEQASDTAVQATAILAKKCGGCHNANTRTSGLNVLSREGVITGGNRGPAIVPNRPSESRMIQAIHWTGELKMPPGGKLSDSEIAALEAWIAAGAPAAKMAAEAAGARKKSDHWAFQPVGRPIPPRVRNQHWVKNDIDRFVLARLEHERITPSPEAAPANLVRRVYLDVTGLPPAREDVAQYIADRSPDRYERLVDRLLASEHYGERWGEHWLDEARYADSDGGSRDEPRQIWRYRDWVIAAFNHDMPYSEFVTEQIAGDLMPNATVEQRIATGFNRNSPLQIEAGTDREQYRVEAVADRVDTTGTVFLGLSVGCARCHDHKFDPISQREYYQLFSFFNNIDEYSRDIPSYLDTQDLAVTHAPLMAIGSKEEVAKWEAIRAQLLSLYRERFEFRGGEAGLHKNDEGDKARTATIDDLKKRLPALPVTLVMQEMAQPRTAHVLLGGDYQRPGMEVQPGVLRALNPAPARSDEKPLNRLDLARWMTDARNPLLARVRVNRMWEQYFGLGIVETENDFGTKGALPSHPELLDWLADQFMEHGWSQKYVARLILTSAAYRQSSKARPELETRDPLNRLLARQSRLRLDAEAIRDSGLAVSGLLNPQAGGPGVYPPQPDGVMETGQVKQPWPTSTGPDKYRRGMYTFRYRITPNPAMKVFDDPGGTLVCTRRARTDTPLQALALLDDPNYHEMAAAFAKRVVAQPAAGRMDYAFRLAFGRPPSAAETARLGRFVAIELDSFETAPAEALKMAGTGATPELAAWTSLGRVLLNTDEFITRE